MASLAEGRLLRAPHRKDSDFLHFEQWYLWMSFNERLLVLDVPQRLHLMVERDESSAAAYRLAPL
eukprot:scaffold121936_cov33-Tisochrysis_lutea.AAC.1